MILRRTLSFRRPRALDLFLTLLILVCFTSMVNAQDKPYDDLTHFSNVFGHNKFYRIYLPEDYSSGGRRYPVIYFFHGWGGRHFKDDNALLEYDKIGELIEKYQVILVMWDGNIEESEPRPYNIGNHKDIKYNVQMKDYFPELVTYIDSTYRTLSDRNQRGIIGFSMGGIMSFFLAGKYPDKVCAAVNLAGTPEFFIGYPENHTLYPLRYTFRNLMHVNTRQHSGDSDILVYLNEEVKKGAEWEGNPYEFYGFKGGHMVDKPGETEAFEMAIKFVADNFAKNPSVPTRWSHYDIYNEFDLWEYSVESNKNVPGFINLSDVSKEGFGFYTHKWLPDGPPIDKLESVIKTTPLYFPSKTYSYITWSADSNNVVSGKITSGADGRIHFSTDGAGSEFGIYDETSGPDFIVTKYYFNDSNRLLKSGETNALYIELLNRGNDIKTRENLKTTLRTSDETVYFPTGTVDMMLNAGQRVIQLPPFEVFCKKLPPAHGEPYQVKLTIDIETDDSLFTDEILLPVLFDVPCFDSIIVDDGREIGDKAFGDGNGDGIAGAGERILLYNGQHRLRLFTNDPWIRYNEEVLLDRQIPAIWEDGFVLSSVVSIDENCPDGHIIEFTGYYETNTWNPIERSLHWGKAFIIVRHINTIIK